MLTYGFSDQTGEFAKHLAGKDPVARFDALLAIMNRGIDAAPFLADLFRCVEDPDHTEIRLAATAVLGGMRSGKREAIPFLLSRLFDSNLFIRKTAILALRVHFSACAATSPSRGLALEFLYDAASKERSPLLRAELICVIHALEGRQDLSGTVVLRAAGEMKDPPMDPLKRYLGED
jgi:HEAT repeat protein